jgi:hypothetical protein
LKIKIGIIKHLSLIIHLLALISDAYTEHTHHMLQQRQKDTS